MTKTYQALPGVPISKDVHDKAIRLNIENGGDGEKFELHEHFSAIITSEQDELIR